MFWRGKNRARSGADLPTLDSISFNVDGWTCTDAGSEEAPRIWETPEGDHMALAVCWGPEAFPPGMNTLADLSAHCIERLIKTQRTLVEVSVEVHAGGPVYRIVHKARQEPLGFSYSAMVLIPFHRFGFMIVVRCEERGITGLREALAVDGMLKGKILSAEQVQQLLGSLDPDHEVSDEALPDHPLSRLHGHLRRIEETLTISATVRAMPRPSPLPAGGD
jgi:hypothetical protein